MLLSGGYHLVVTRAAAQSLQQHLRTHLGFWQDLLFLKFNSICKKGLSCLASDADERPVKFVSVSRTDSIGLSDSTCLFLWILERLT
jgi:hypothetical protein